MQYNNQRRGSSNTKDKPATYVQAPPYELPGGEQNQMLDESNPFVININRETLLNDIFSISSGRETVCRLR